MFNAVVLVALVIGLARMALMSALCAKVRITALDRVGVINKEKLEEEFPRLAVNPRHTLAMWIVEDELAQLKIALIVGIAAAVGNILLVVLLCRKTRTNSRADTTIEVGERNGTTR